MPNGEAAKSSPTASQPDPTGSGLLRLSECPGPWAGGVWSRVFAQDPCNDPYSPQLENGGGGWMGQVTPQGCPTSKDNGSFSGYTVSLGKHFRAPENQGVYPPFLSSCNYSTPLSFLLFLLFWTLSCPSHHSSFPSLLDTLFHPSWPFLFLLCHPDLLFPVSAFLSAAYY